MKFIPQKKIKTYFYIRIYTQKILSLYIIIIIIIIIIIVFII